MLLGIAVLCSCIASRVSPKEPPPSWFHAAQEQINSLHSSACLAYRDLISFLRKSDRFSACLCLANLCKDSVSPSAQSVLWLSSYNFADCCIG